MKADRNSEEDNTEIRQSASRGGTTIIALLDQAAFGFAAFGSTILIGRFCSQDELGFFTLGMSIVLVIVDLQISIVSTPYMVFSPRLGPAAHASYSGSTLIHQIALSLAAVGLLAGVGGAALSAAGLPSYRQMMPYVTGALAFVMMREYVRRVCFARFILLEALILDVCVTFLQIGSMLFLAVKGNLSANTAFLAIAGANGIPSAIWILMRRGSFNPNAQAVLRDTRRDWRFGKWVFASGMLWSISMQFFPWALAVYRNAAAVGVWGACSTVVAVARIPMAGIQNYLGPNISASFAIGGERKVRTYVASTAVKFGLMMLVLTAIVSLAGGSLLTFLYGPAYRGNGIVISLMALSLVPAAIAFCHSRALFTLQRAATDALVNIVPLAFLLTAGTFLIMAYGLIGAAIGLFSATVLATVVRWVYFYSTRTEGNDTPSRS